MTHHQQGQNAAQSNQHDGPLLQQLMRDDVIQLLYVNGQLPQLRC